MAQKFELELVLKDAAAAQSVGDIKKQLKELKNAMLTVGEGSAEFNKLAAAAAELKDKVEESNEAINNMNPDKFKGLQKMAEGAAVGMQLVTSSMALMGVESEDAQKAMMKVQAAMAFGQAINDIDKLKKGFKEFNDTIKANPIIAVAAALVALSVAAYKVWRSQEDLKLQSTLLEKQLEKQKVATENLHASIDAQILVLEAQGGQEEAIYHLRRQAMEQDISNLKLSIEKHKAKIQEVSDTDSLWESVMKLFIVYKKLAGTEQEVAAAEAAIAQNKQERREEEQKLLQEDINNLTILEGTIQALDINYENFLKNKNKGRAEDNANKVEDQKVTDEQLIIEANALADELIAIEQAKNDELDAIEAAHQKRREQLYKEDQKRSKDLDDAKLAYKKAASARAKKIDELENQFRIDAIRSTLGIVGDLFKENAEVQKAVGAATTLVDTYAAAQAAFKAAAASPLATVNPAYPFISAGLAVAAGLARVAAILRVDTSGGAVSATGGGGGGNTGSLQVSSQPNVSSGSQPSTLLTEQGTVANQQTQNPIYVSVSEIREVDTVVQAVEDRNRF